MAGRDDLVSSLPIYSSGFAKSRLRGLFLEVVMLLHGRRGYCFAEQLGLLCGFVVGAVERYVAVEPDVEALLVLGGQINMRRVGGVADDFSQRTDICADSTGPGDYRGN